MHPPKPEKTELEPYRPNKWLSPFERMEDMLEDLLRRPFGLEQWPSIQKLMEGVEPSSSVDILDEADNKVKNENVSIKLILSAV